MNPMPLVLLRPIAALTLAALLALATSVPLSAATATATLPAPAATTRLAKLVQLSVRPDRADWTYRPGENVRFDVRLTINRHEVAGQTVHYEIGPEMMPPVRRGDVVLGANGLTLEGGTLSAPGFLRCVVTTEIDGERFRALATAGFAPEQIAPTQTVPADFEDFWAEGLKELAAVPLDPELTPLPELSTARVETFMLRLKNVGVHLTPGQAPRPSALYGVLCVPRDDGPFPAVLALPGAGVRGYRGLVELAERGCITLQLDIHGLPVNLPSGVYLDLATGALADYRIAGTDDRARHYFRRVYLGCVRANDYLVTLPKWDRRHLVAFGGSQGGQLAIVTAALDARVTALAALYPAYCDVTGFLHGRAGGWGHLFKPLASGETNPLATPARVATSGYYDTVNFARRVRVPGFYSWGFNDEICPPTSTFSAYNQITAPKELVLYPETGHAVLPAQTERAHMWILQQCRPASAAPAPRR